MKRSCTPKGQYPVVFFLAGSIRARRPPGNPAPPLKARAYSFSQDTSPKDRERTTVPMPALNIIAIQDTVRNSGRSSYPLSLMLP